MSLDDVNVMLSPEVTVVIPTRDRRSRLAATLAGVCRQHDVEMELIVVDDASTDGTADYVAALGDPCIRVIRRERPGGPAKARNAGIAAARGRWIAFLDDDDLWAPDKLRRQLDAAHAEGASWCYCAAAHVDDKAHLIFVDRPPDPTELTVALRGRNPVPAGASSVIVEAPLLRRLEGFDEGLSHFADWDMWIRLAAAGRAAAVHQPLVGYVQHSANMRIADPDSLRSELRRLDAKHHRTGGRSDPERAALLRWIAEGYLGAGKRLAASRLYASLAVRWRSPRDVGGIVATFVDALPAGSNAAWRVRSRAAATFTPRLAWLDEYVEFPLDRAMPAKAEPDRRAHRRTAKLPGWKAQAQRAWRSRWRIGLPVAWSLVVMTRMSDRQVGIAVVFHEVGDPPAVAGAEVSIRVSRASFERQIAHLARWYQLVPASQLHRAIRGRRRGQRVPAAITLDDDVRSHIDAAAPVLRRHRVSATFFLTGSSLDGPVSFWWERLDRAIRRGMPSDHPMLPRLAEAGDTSVWARGPADALGEAVRLLPSAERAALGEKLLELAGPDPERAGLRDDDLRRLRALGFEIGFHTLRHDSLPQLDDEQLARAMTEGRSRLEAIVGAPLRTIAYPHGRADERVARAAAAAGYIAGYTTDGGAIGRSANTLLLPRFDPAGLDLGQFALWLARDLWRAGA
jgi:peptidoglycan/xylan/chitin deacetylase (PgdA/CDA1 family)/GT2 family glycosyltransferase